VFVIGRRPLDATIDGLLPAPWQLTVREFYIDEYAIRVRYEIRPVVRDDDIWSVIPWVMTGEDDQGGTYAEAGGAFGDSVDGSYTEGERSLSPIPPEDSSWIDLAFFSADDLDGKPCQVVRLPLGR
jgi:hypothetical protein